MGSIHNSQNMKQNEIRTLCVHEGAVYQAEVQVSSLFIAIHNKN